MNSIFLGDRDTYRQDGRPRQLCPAGPSSLRFRSLEIKPDGPFTSPSPAAGNCRAPRPREAAPDPRCPILGAGWAPQGQRGGQGLAADFSTETRLTPRASRIWGCRAPTSPRLSRGPCSGWLRGPGTRGSRKGSTSCGQRRGSTKLSCAWPVRASQRHWRLVTELIDKMH